MSVAAVQQAASRPLREVEPAVAAMAAASPAFAAAMELQQNILNLATDKLQLAPAHCSAVGPASGGLFTTSSEDGNAGAVIAACQGSGVHSLSASAMVNSQFGFGTTRLLGFVGADADTPHFGLEQGVQGDKLQGLITLWPRQDWVTDLDYLHTYYSTVPPGSSEGQRCYNDIHNGAMATAEKLGWRHYNSPVAEVKPLLASSIAYTLPTQPDSLAAFREVALEVAQLWVALVQAQESGKGKGGGKGASAGSGSSSSGRVRSEAALYAYDARHLAAITSDPGNGITVKLFGGEATDTLLKMVTGHPAVAGS